MEDLTNKVSAELSGTHDVYYAMRYKNPSIVNVLKEIQSKSYDEVVLFPVFPQYSSAANGSFLEMIHLQLMSIAEKREIKLLHHSFLIESPLGHLRLTGFCIS